MMPARCGMLTMLVPLVRWRIFVLGGTRLCLKVLLLVTIQRRLNHGWSLRVNSLRELRPYFPPQRSTFPVRVVPTWVPPIGTRQFVENFVNNKVSEWSDDVSTLADIAKSQPHAAYAAINSWAL